MFHVNLLLRSSSPDHGDAPGRPSRNQRHGLLRVRHVRLAAAHHLLDARGLRERGERRPDLGRRPLVRGRPQHAHHPRRQARGSGLLRLLGCGRGGVGAGPRAPRGTGRGRHAAAHHRSGGVQPDAAAGNGGRDAVRGPRDARALRGVGAGGEAHQGPRQDLPHAPRHTQDQR